MQVTVRCPSCRSRLPITVASPPGEIKCGRCSLVIPLSFTDAVREDRAVDRCPVCEGRDFYTRKDFDPNLGLAVIVTGAAISVVFYWYGLDLMAYGVLAGAALVDFAIYRWLRDVTVCYRCHAEFRGRHERTAGGFDLHTADLLEPEWQRKIGRR